ncbi:MAG: ABC transporter permease [Chloroflexi bacterium]|nr:ABC transporter permease [Chloroflexota bacterium]
MRAVRLTVRQIGFEHRAFWRNPVSAFFTFVFPLLFLVIFNLLFGNEEFTVAGGTTTTATFYVPAIAAFSVINACYTGVAITVSLARDQGQLKRAAGTPMPKSAYLFGKVAYMTVIAMALVVVVIVFGVVFYGVDVPTGTLPAFALSLAVGAATFAMLGLALTAFIPNADAAPAVVNATVLPLLFISDIFIPPNASAPAWLGTLADVFPLKHLSLALQTAYNPFESGPGLEPAHLVVLVAWGVVGAAVALWRFGWEPRG